VFWGGGGRGGKEKGGRRPAKGGKDRLPVLSTHRNPYLSTFSHWIEGQEKEGGGGRKKKKKRKRKGTIGRAGSVSHPIAFVLASGEREKEKKKKIAGKKRKKRGEKKKRPLASGLPRATARRLYGRCQIDEEGKVKRRKGKDRSSLRVRLA